MNGGVQGRGGRIVSARRSLPALLVLLFLAACGPAPLEDNLTAYQRLLYQMQAEGGEGDVLWFPATAPPGARRLMAALKVNAVYYDRAAETVYFRSGGGYLPERGYVYRFPLSGGAGADRSAPGYREEHLVGNWYYRAQP
jgi:hypothetical protein